MPAPRQDLHIQEAETWSHAFVYRVGGAPADLTGYSARCRIVRRYDSPLVFELTTGNGRIAIDGPAGQVTLRLSSAETLQLRDANVIWDLLEQDDRSRDTLSAPRVEASMSSPEFAAERWVYDVEVVSGAGVVTRIVQGRVYLHPSATTTAFF